MIATPASGQAQMLEFELCIGRPFTTVIGDGDRTVFACSKIIGDQTLPAEIRAQAHVRRGAAYGSDDRFLEALNEAVQLNPTDPELLFLRAFARGGFTLKDTKGAIADTDEGIRLNPNAPAGYVLRAQLQLHLAPNPAKNEVALALADLSEALKRPDDQLNAYWNYILKRFFGEFGNWHAFAHAFRGRIYELQGDREHAITDLQWAYCAARSEETKKRLATSIKELGKDVSGAVSECRR